MGDVRWEPAPTGRIEVASGGDSMGVQRLRYIEVMPNGRLHAWMATISVAGESVYGYPISLPDGYAFCRATPAPAAPSVPVDAILACIGDAENAGHTLTAQRIRDWLSSQRGSED